MFVRIKVSSALNILLILAILIYEKRAKKSFAYVLDWTEVDILVNVNILFHSDSTNSISVFGDAVSLANRKLFFHKSMETTSFARFWVAHKEQ